MSKIFSDKEIYDFYKKYDISFLGDEENLRDIITEPKLIEKESQSSSPKSCGCIVINGSSLTLVSRGKNGKLE